MCSDGTCAHTGNAEQCLYEEHQRLQTLIESLPVGIIVIDAEGAIVYVNDVTDHIWRGAHRAKSPAEYGEYKGWWASTGEPIAAEEWAAARALKGETSVGEIIDIQRSDGTRGTILNSAKPIVGRDGEITGAVVVLEDITDTKRTELDLRETQQQLERELRKAERLLRSTELLKEVAVAGASAADIRSLCRRALEVLHEQTDAKASSIYCLDHEAGMLRHLALFGYPAESLSLFENVPLNRDSNLAQAILDDVPYLTSDQVERNPRDSAERSKVAGLSGDSWIVVPIKVGDEPRGGLTILFEGEYHFGRHDIDLYRAVGALLGTAMERARLLEAVQQELEKTADQAKYAEALNRINAVVHSSLESSEIISRAVSEVTRAIGVDATALHVHGDGHWQFTYADNIPPALRSMRLADDEAPLSMRVLETRDTLVVPDVLHDPRANVRLMERFGITALIAVPLIVRGQVFAVLFTGCLGKTSRFSTAQVDFVQRVASTLALALENARLYETERDIADRLQESLLALPDAVNGVTFGHAYHSATEAARVGGDFYDLFELEGERVGIVIGDVAGKGLDAAVLTSTVKNTIRAHANERGKTPGQILELTNEVIFKATPAEAFVTVFFGVLDLVDRRLVYANAGHTQGMIVEGDRSIRPLERTGPLLGALPDVSFEERESRLSDASTLFLYTDGLTEARNAAHVMYGEERLVSFLEHTEAADVERLVDEVLGDVIEYSGRRLRDDLAMLAVRPLA